MKLPNDEVGISDILQYRECPMNFAWSMRRHVDLPDHLRAFFVGDKDVPPEKDDANSAYGSAIHDAIHVVETTRCSDEDAVTAVWGRWGKWLEVEDRDRLLADLETFHRREEVGVRLIASEAEMRVPLFVHEGRQIYFRFRVDRLVQSLANPGLYISRDYKSSRWQRSEKEVHGDIQQWAYNFGLHEYFPEITQLLQVYDQLRYGEVPTRKSADQRRQMREWLIENVKAILADDTLEPKQNDTCQWCPLVMDCPVTHRSTDFWKRRLAALAPEKKVGRKIIVQLTQDPEDFSFYTGMLPEVANTIKMLKRFEDAVKDVLREMPSSEVEEHGFYSIEPEVKKFPPNAMRRVYERMGEEFWHVVSLPMSQLESFFGKGSEELEQIVAMAEKEKGSRQLRARKAA